MKSFSGTSSFALVATLVLGALGPQAGRANPAPSSVLRLGPSPSARTCRLAGGEAWSIALEDGSDQIELCVFGHGMISSLSFFEATVMQQPSQAVTAFLSGAACTGALAYGNDSDGARIGVCLFPDQSFVEEQTLARGPASPANARLVERLSTHASK